MTLSRILISLSLLACLAADTATAQRALYLGGGIGNSFVCGNHGKLGETVVDGDLSVAEVVPGTEVSDLRCVVETQLGAVYRFHWADARKSLG